MRKKSSNHEHGFTLIELLVVITIISILAALLMANFVGIRQRGRDAQRKSDLRQIQTAFELYRSDEGSYPVALYSQNCPTVVPLTSGGVTYMQKVPCDPLNTSTNYTYTPVGTPPTTYTLSACLENDNDIDGVVSGSCASGKAYSLTNP